MNIGKSMLAASTFAGALFLASTIAPLPGLAQGVGADGTAPGEAAGGGRTARCGNGGGLWLGCAHEHFREEMDVTHR